MMSQPPESYLGEADAASLYEFHAGEPAGSGEWDPSSDAAFQAREEERTRERQALLARLNERQVEAVDAPAESLLVLAGAGSGKTSVLTARIASLVSTGKAQARNVLAVTFTNKAAQEMRHRLTKLLDKRAVHDLWMGTFHSLCNKLLRENYEAAGLPKAFAILDVDGQEALCRGILKDFGLTRATVKEAAKARAVAAQSDLLSAADPLAGVGGLGADDVEDEGEANEFVTPAQCAKYISARKEALESPQPPMSISTRSSDVEQMEAVFAQYQERCKRAGLLDFQDLLTSGVALLEGNEEVRNQYRGRFTAILVDEFQDTNDLQYRWLQMMKGPKAHVMAVGDDSQSIYAFRGANPANMHRFVREMTISATSPEGRVVKLEQNYRSLPHILEAANAIIDCNPNQLRKTLFTSQRDRGERIDLVTFGNGMFEAGSIADSAHNLIRDHEVPPSEIAILYRTNQQSRLLEQEMNKRGLPVTVYGGYRFYDRQEIKNVMAYLDLVCDMTRDLSFARVANFPPRGLGERTVEELRQAAQERRVCMMEMVGERAAQLERDPKTFGNAAAQKKQRQLESFTGVILDLADAAQSTPLSQLIDRLMDRAGIRQHYMDEAGGSKSSQAEAEERLANVAELVSAAKQFEIDNPTLATASQQMPEYLSHVALMTSTSESDMSKKNTVSLMTVHSSKGLEFDHVFLAGLEEGIFPHSRALDSDAEAGNGLSVEEALQRADGEESDAQEEPELEGAGLQEERRLMYVAVTRARKTLTITHARERLQNGEPTRCEPSRFIDEIPDRRLNRIDDAKAHHGSRKPRLSSVGNHEYGGDAFDQGRAEHQPRRPRAAKPAQEAPAAEPARGANPATIRFGAVRVVSKRKGGEPEAEGEVVIDVDRNHPVLGNRHILQDHKDDDERARVIAAYGADFEADLASRGPMYREVRRLALRVAQGERIALRCWCAPRECHADLIAAKVAEFAREHTPAGAASPSDHSPAPAAPGAPAADAPLKPWMRRGAAAVRPAAPSTPVDPPAPAPALRVVPNPLAPKDGGRTLAIIGTAGRDKDKPMTRQLWERMVADAKTRVRKEDTLVSGGAAWADHLAVRLYLDGDAGQLIVHLPAPLAAGKFAGPAAESAGSAANYYHARFKKATGVDGLAELQQAIDRGASSTEQPAAVGYGAMFARNALVAKAASAVIAYTFGDGDVPADGGTKDTWEQIRGERVHVPLMALGPLSSSPLPQLPTTPLPSSSPSGSGAIRMAPPPGAMARLDLLGKRRTICRP